MTDDATLALPTEFRSRLSSLDPDTFLSCIATSCELASAAIEKGKSVQKTLTSHLMRDLLSSSSSLIVPVDPTKMEGEEEEVLLEEEVEEVTSLIRNEGEDVLEGVVEMAHRSIGQLITIRSEVCF